MKPPSALLLVLSFTSMACPPHKPQGPSFVDLQWPTCTPHVAPTLVDTPPDLVAWLNAHPAIVKHMKWHVAASNGAITALPFSDWPNALRGHLFDYFARYWAWHVAKLSGPEPDAFGDPVPNIREADSPATTGLVTVISDSDAQAMYASSLAMALVLDIGRVVDWSLGEYDDESLALLLDSAHFFAPQKGGYRVLGYVTPAPPSFSVRFMHAHGGSCRNRREAIGSLLMWMHRIQHKLELAPYTINNGFDVQRAYWQYDGAPPVSRMVNGTVVQGIPPDAATGFDLQSPQHWSFGCTTGASLVRALLRSVNIPARVLEPMSPGTGHSSVELVADRAALSHGDDPYSRAIKTLLPFPLDAFLVDEQVWQGWYLGVSSDVAHRNVERQLVEMEITYGSKEMLAAHFSDLQRKLSHEQSSVYRVLNERIPYSVDELERRGLWQRLDAWALPYVDDPIGFFAALQSIKWPD